jgi:signal transduction histidine kinase/ActR/RegA family two-component response regulator
VIRAAPVSLRRKVITVVVLATGVALLISATALLLYELRSYQTEHIAQLHTQARMLTSGSVGPLAVGDASAVAEDLGRLALNPHLLSAAVYRADGILFAGTPPPGAPQAPAPSLGAARPGLRVGWDVLELSEPVMDEHRTLGTVVLRSRFDLLRRLADYLLILAAAMLPGLLMAALLASRLQAAVTGQILQVAHIARGVLERRDFSARAPKTSGDEVGVLVDAFNNMLEEVGRRTEALEQSNRHLSQETAERRRAEEALRAAGRTKDRFLATLAHELRSPLAPVANAVILLRNADVDDATKQRALEVMERQVRQMVRLIDDLLDVSRINTGKVSLEVGRVNVAEVLRCAVEIASPGIEARGHRLAIELPSAPVWIPGDAMRLAQVFANLLNNAAKYTERGGSIAVRVEESLNEVVVHFHDTGVGIAPDQQDSIFDMYVQVEQPAARGMTRSGLGVGLALARQLIELHGGRIEVHSAGLGQGSDFLVHLQRGEVLSPVVHAIPALGAPPARHRVLVVDDNVDFARGLQSVLESLGQEVTVVHDGHAALEAAVRVVPEFVFLNLNMPGPDGHEVARRLRIHRATRDAVMVALSDGDRPQDRERARQAGFDHYVVKPLGVDQLAALLRARTDTATAS